jgi:hypothetical protein
VLSSWTPRAQPGPRRFDRPRRRWQGPSRNPRSSPAIATARAPSSRAPSKLANDSSCFEAWGGSAPLLLTVLGGQGSIRFGRAPREPGTPITWHKTWLTDVAVIATERFDFDRGYGIGTEEDLRFVRPPAESSVGLGGSAHVAHGLGDQLVWAGTTGAIRSYTGTGPAIDLVPIPAPRKLRLSEDRLVWISAAPNGETFKDAKWHWSPRTKQPSGIVVHDGPSLPTIIDGGRDMQVGGEWAASLGCTAPGGVCQIDIWHITTGETLVLPHRPQHRFSRIFAISPTEIVLGEAVAAKDDFKTLHHLVRIELSALPALAKAWGGN